MVCLDKMQWVVYPGGPKAHLRRGLVCLDVRAYRDSDGISRRANHAPEEERELPLTERGNGWAKVGGGLVGMDVR